MTQFFDSKRFHIHPLSFHWPDRQQSVPYGGFEGVQEEISSQKTRVLPLGLVAGRWHLHQGNEPVHNSIMVTNYFTTMGMKTVLHPYYSLDLALCDFWLFLKLKENFRNSHFEDIEEMKVDVTDVLDTFTLKDFHGAYTNLLNTGFSDGNGSEIE
ncbi:uncharacterized protein LOC106867902 [Octopus bimaculoides]|uniref:uncharacterized protein LOC106867902 n=1 Tax=Octopus bimaculoides TaxID=37653 RepID=UPI00071CA446|nr:uncharacterized protein LOC106867902 [Octopus bimaculoides]|eukprot:XP_014768460.1 PREDICTED: uncharacterized protein LOC106867902 [Octopus bimaculoides]